MKYLLLAAIILFPMVGTGQDRALDEKNGFKDIKLNSKVSLYPNLSLRKKISVKDVPDTELYIPKNGTYSDVGGIKINKMEVITYRSIVYEIKIYVVKEPKFYKGLEKTYGPGEYSMKDNAYHWNGKKLNMKFHSINKNKVLLTYHSMEVDSLIKADKAKEIEGIADDF